MQRSLAAGIVSLLSAAWLAGCAQESASDGDTSAAYIVANFRITDPDGYAAYPPLARPLLQASGAEVLVVDRATEALEGEPEHVTVVIRFPSKEAARAFYDAPEYREIVHLRTDNSEGFMALTSGVVPP